MEADILRLEKKELDLRIGCSVNGRVIPTYDTRLKKEEKIKAAEKELNALMDCFSVPQDKKRSRNKSKAGNASGDLRFRTTSLESSSASSFKTAKSRDCQSGSSSNTEDTNTNSSSSSSNQSNTSNGCRGSRKGSKIHSVLSGLAELSIHSPRRKEKRKADEQVNTHDYFPS